ncbi:HAD hydrolase family protein [Candidatus Eisenbacteria bacterium]|uniref:HAD hydrolase family protein n=1 Tax=Eiseniibacteriota bacterium TaxID=2212470 RepID=A0ABV6YJN3_UNCEI
MGYDLIVSDIDGTLLDGRDRLSPLTQETILELIARGVRFATASARTRPNCVDALGPIHEKCCALACANGCFVTAADGTVLEDIALDGNLFAGLLDVCDDAGASYCCVSSDDAVACVRHEMLARIFELFHLRYSLIDDAREATSLPVSMVAVYAEQTDTVESFIQSHAAQLAISPISHSPRLDLRFFFVQNRAVDKGSALEKIAAHFGIPAESTLALGDGLWNDGPLLAAAGYAVAMKNARSQLRGMADVVTELDNTDDGAAHFLRSFFRLP